jgi:hypothetical protein
MDDLVETLSSMRLDMAEVNLEPEYTSASWTLVVNMLRSLPRNQIPALWVRLMARLSERPPPAPNGVSREEWIRVCRSQFAVMYQHAIREAGFCTNEATIDPYPSSSGDTSALLKDIGNRMTGLTQVVDGIDGLKETQEKLSSSLDQLSALTKTGDEIQRQVVGLDGVVGTMRSTLSSLDSLKVSSGNSIQALNQGVEKLEPLSGAISQIDKRVEVTSTDVKTLLESSLKLDAKLTAQDEASIQRYATTLTALGTLSKEHEDRLTTLIVNSRDQTTTSLTELRNAIPEVLKKVIADSKVFDPDPVLEVELAAIKKILGDVQVKFQDVVKGETIKGLQDKIEADSLLTSTKLQQLKVSNDGIFDVVAKQGAATFEIRASTIQHATSLQTCAVNLTRLVDLQSQTTTSLQALRETDLKQIGAELRDSLRGYNDKHEESMAKFLEKVDGEEKKKEGMNESISAIINKGLKELQGHLKEYNDKHVESMTKLSEKVDGEEKKMTDMNESISAINKNLAELQGRLKDYNEKHGESITTLSEKVDGEKKQMESLADSIKTTNKSLVDVSQLLLDISRDKLDTTTFEAAMNKSANGKTSDEDIKKTLEQVLKANPQQSSLKIEDITKVITAQIKELETRLKAEKAVEDTSTLEKNLNRYKSSINEINEDLRGKIRESMDNNVQEVREVNDRMMKTAIQKCDATLESTVTLYKLSADQIVKEYTDNQLANTQRVVDAVIEHLRTQWQDDMRSMLEKHINTAPSLQTPTAQPETPRSEPAPDRDNITIERGKIAALTKYARGKNLIGLLEVNDVDITRIETMLNTFWNKFLKSKVEFERMKIIGYPQQEATGRGAMYVIENNQFFLNQEVIISLLRAHFIDPGDHDKEKALKAPTGQQIEHPLKDFVEGLRDKIIHLKYIPIALFVSLCNKYCKARKGESSSAKSDYSGYKERQGTFYKFCYSNDDFNLEDAKYVQLTQLNPQVRYHSQFDYDADAWFEKEISAPPPDTWLRTMSKQAGWS